MLRAALISTMIIALLAVGCNQAAPSAQSAPTVAPTATATPPAASGGNFGELMSGSARGNYKVVYKMTGTASGQSMSGEQTMYQKPPKRRMDMSVAQAGGAMSMFMLDEGTFLCMGSQMCTKMPAEQTDQATAAQKEMQNRPEDYDANPAGTRQIAGQSANCFNVKPKQTGGGFEQALYCLTSAGIPVLMQVKGSGFDMTMEATSVSTTVNDSDFQLPVPVTEMPTGIPGMPPGMPVVPGAPAPR